MKKQFLDNLISQAGAALIAYRRIRPKWTVEQHCDHLTDLGICNFTNKGYKLIGNELSNLCEKIVSLMKGESVFISPTVYLSSATYAEVILPRIEYLELILEEAHKIKRTIK